jgi:hypothetical protein
VAQDEIFPADVPSSAVFDEDTYKMAIETAVDGQSKSGKRMFSILARCKEGPFEGWPRFYNFVTGSDKNPLAIEKHNRGTIDLQKLVTACGVTFAGQPIGAVLVSLVTKEYGEWMGQRLNKESNELENSTKRFFKLGEYPIGQGPLSQASAAKPGNAGPQTRSCASCGKSDIPAAEFSAHAETCATA